jgi:molecular chaperone GrpE
MNQQDQSATDPTGEPAVAAEPTAAAAGPADAAPPDDATAELQRQVADLKDRLLRALAEVENTRRRAERDREDASKYAITTFARSLLAVGDNLKRALDAVPAEARNGNDALATLLAGVDMTERELQAVFSRHGIKTIDALGAKFDANLHQAMFEIDGSGQAPGTIVQVIESGYVIADRLLRPALVGVAKASAAAPTPDPAVKIDTKA